MQHVSYTLFKRDFTHHIKMNQTYLGKDKFCKHVAFIMMMMMIFSKGGTIQTLEALTVNITQYGHYAKC